MKNLIILSIILFGILYSCGKDSEPSSQINPKVSINLDAQSNGKVLTADKYYSLNGTDSILISRLDFYVQKFVLNTSDSVSGTKLYSLFDSANLKFQYNSNATYYSINRVAFMSGLDSQTNRLDPNTQAVSSPLGGNKNMYWVGWSKYRYVVLEGSIKTPDTTYKIAYHTGLDYRAVTDIPKAYQITQGSTQVINIHLNINKIFYPTNGANIKYKEGETKGHSEPSEKDLMTKFTTNFGNAFSIE